MATIAERRAVLDELERRGIADLAKLWRAADLSEDFRALIMAAFPEMVLTWGMIAADIAAVWYDEAAPSLPYKARVANPPPVEKFAKSADWALNVGTGTSGLALLEGVLQRGVWDMARDTTMFNVGLEQGAGWARHASANACEFCRMLATRGAVYGSKDSASRVGGRGNDVSTNFRADGSRKRGGQARGVRARGTQRLGDKYHDHCHCVAVEVRPGGYYEPPPYVVDWEEEYARASAIAREKPRATTTRHGIRVDLTSAGAGDLKDIQRIMRDRKSVV